jgi:hypothetical protein
MLANSQGSNLPGEAREGFPTEELLYLAGIW